MIDIVATLAEATSIADYGMGRTLGTYLLSVEEGVQDEEIIQECLSIYWGNGGLSPDQLSDGVMVSCRRADPQSDRLLYAQSARRGGASIH